MKLLQFIDAVEDSTNVLAQEFPMLFSGLGCTDSEVNVTLNPEVEPFRRKRLPLGVRSAPDFSNEKCRRFGHSKCCQTVVILIYCMYSEHLGEHDKKTTIMILRRRMLLNRFQHRPSMTQQTPNLRRLLDDTDCYWSAQLE